MTLLLLPQISAAVEDFAKPVPTKKIINGIELLYNWEFKKAEDLFHSIIAEKPEDPAGYFYLAMVSWSRLSSGFWSPKIVKEYYDRIDEAILIAGDRVKDPNPDSYSYFYLGGALGFKGRFQLMQRQWISSFFLAVDAVDALKTCYRMDTDNHDVLLGLGIFDYYSARLKGVKKWLSYLLIHKGDRAEGLRKIQIAADRAVYSSIESKNLLLYVYLFLEHDYNKALPLAKELAKRFNKVPRNGFLLGINYIRLEKHPEYRKQLIFLKTGGNQTSGTNPDKWIQWALYLEASNDLFHGQYSRARSKLESILAYTNSKETPFMSAWPLIKTGMSYDIEGKREKALDYYNKIMKMENGAGAQFLAKKYIKNPARKNDPFLGY